MGSNKIVLVEIKKQNAYLVYISVEIRDTRHVGGKVDKGRDNRETIIRRCANWKNTAIRYFYIQRWPAKAGKRRIK